MKKESWYMRQLKNLETYPAIMAIFACIWFLVLQPAIAKDFCTKKEMNALKTDLEKIEKEFKTSDLRIEEKIDNIGNKIDNIYQLLINTK